MSEDPTIWPPPHKTNDVPENDKFCPHCKRKLLTQGSALCNWCGAKIDDEEYLARAAQIRQESDRAERDRLDVVLKETAAHGPYGRLKMRAKELKKKKEG